MIRVIASLAFLLPLVGCGETAPADAPNAANNSIAAAGKVTKAKMPEPLPDIVRVRLETEVGPILVALDARRAPITAANFVRYADEGRFDGTSFYRASVTEGTTDRGFIQGGIRRNYQRMLPPIKHEPTSETGLKHEPGTISMASTGPGTATGNFFITVSAQPAMDANGDEEGYAAFGRVAEGMDVVRRILAAETVANAGRGAMRGEMIAKPVTIVSAKRVE